MLHLDLRLTVGLANLKRVQALCLDDLLMQIVPDRSVRAPLSSKVKDSGQWP